MLSSLSSRNETILTSKQKEDLLNKHFSANCTLNRLDFYLPAFHNCCTPYFVLYPSLSLEGFGYFEVTPRHTSNGDVILTEILNQGEEMLTGKLEEYFNICLDREKTTTSSH